jgi:O-glycosyl hydrolase
MYDEYAETVVTMAAYARRRAGIEFEYFSPVNEIDCYPGEGPRVDPEDMPQLLEAVARRLASEGLGDVRLVVSEQASIGTDYIGPILHKPSLMPHVGALALHAYGDASVGANVNTVRRSDFPNTPVWLTEYGDLNDLDRTAGNDTKNASSATPTVGCSPAPATSIRRENGTGRQSTCSGRSSPAPNASRLPRPRQDSPFPHSAMTVPTP